MGVEESNSGTMVAEKGQQSPDSKAKTPEEASKVSPEEEPKIYTQKQADALVHAVKSESGREKASLEKQVTELTGKLKAKDDEISDVNEEIKKLEDRVDGLTKDDPEKFEAVKELRAAREERRQLKTDRRTLEDEKTTHAEQVKVANETMREINIWEISSEFQDADPVKLKGLCDSVGVNSVEQIRQVAETIWAKKEGTPEPKAEAPKVYSGESEGGTQKTYDDTLKARYPSMFPKK